jgi:hypothetical protein
MSDENAWMGMYVADVPMSNFLKKALIEKFGTEVTLGDLLNVSQHELKLIPRMGAVGVETIARIIAEAAHGIVKPEVSLGDKVRVFSEQISEGTYAPKVRAKAGRKAAA